MFLKIFGGGMFDGVYKMLSVNLFSSSGDYGTAFTFIHNIYNDVVMPIGLYLLLIYFIIGITEKVTSDLYSQNQLVKELIKLVVAIFIISNAMDILQVLWHLGSLVLKDIKVQAGIHGMSVTDTMVTADSIKNGTSAYSKALGEAYKELTGKEWGQKIGVIKSVGLWFQLVLPYLVAVILKIAVNVICYIRIFEIFIRAMFSPIPLSDFFFQGVHSSGWRFIKKFLAVSLQGFMIFGCVILYSALSTVILEAEAVGGNLDYFSFMLKFLGLNGAALGVILKSQSLISEFVGA